MGPPTWDPADQISVTLPGNKGVVTYGLVREFTEEKVVEGQKSCPPWADFEWGEWSPCTGAFAMRCFELAGLIAATGL